jgi:hypothetical protein
MEDLFNDRGKLIDMLPPTIPRNILHYTGVHLICGQYLGAKEVAVKHIFQASCFRA